jgi:polar amino acid transport system substrate-binding protein
LDKDTHHDTQHDTQPDTSMKKNSRHSFRAIGSSAIAVVLTALTLTACGSSKATVSPETTLAVEAPTTETPVAEAPTSEAPAAEAPAAEAPAAEAPAATGSLFDTLPQSIKDSKVVRVGSDVTYPPYESFKEGSTTEVIGFDADYAAELSKMLGVEFKLENGSFDSLITGVDAGRYDAILSGMTDKKERQAKVDFVDYQKSGFAILVKKGNAVKIVKPEDLCGHKVGLQTATSQIDFVKAIKCDKPIEISEFPTEDEARLAVSSGRVDADVADLPPMADFLKTAAGGDFEISSTEQYETGLLGMAVSKKLPELRDAVQTATNELMKNGTYDKLLAKWGLEATKITESTVNGGS